MNKTKRLGAVTNLSASSVSSWVLRRLGALPGVKVASDKRRTHRITLRIAQGTRVAFDVIEERTVSEERARILAASARRPAGRTLVATARLTERARVALRNAGISWIERETGRCRLTGPGMLIEFDTDGEPETQIDVVRSRHTKKTPPSLLRDKSGLLAETLLMRPREARIVLSEVAVASGLSRALVSRLLARLTSLEILDAHGSAPRKHWTLRDAGALLDLWSNEERVESEEVTSISAWSRTPSALFDRLGTANRRYAIGGAGAANLYVPTLTVAPVTDIWIPADVPATQIAADLGGELVEGGANVRVLQTSGDFALRNAHLLPAVRQAGPGTWLVSPYRAYVEARRTSGRGPDVAAALRRTLPLASKNTKATSNG